MRKSAALMLSMAVVGMLFAVSPASAACGSSGGRTALTSGTPVAGDVDNTQTDKYVFTVPPGQSGYLGVQMFNGDVDIEVCNNAGNAVVCSGHNMAGIHDGCHVSEASIALPSPPWSEGTYLAEWGNALPTGTYRLDVNHCFSSEDAEACDYADPLETGVTTGALDDAPPVQYVVLFVAN